MAGFVWGHSMASGQILSNPICPHLNRNLCFSNVLHCKGTAHLCFNTEDRPHRPRVQQIKSQAVHKQPLYFQQ